MSALRRQSLITLLRHGQWPGFSKIDNKTTKRLHLKTEIKIHAFMKCCDRSTNAIKQVYQRVKVTTMVIPRIKSIKNYTNILPKNLKTTNIINLFTLFLFVKNISKLNKEYSIKFTI